MATTKKAAAKKAPAKKTAAKKTAAKKAPAKKAAAKKTTAPKKDVALDEVPGNADELVGDVVSPDFDPNESLEVR